MADLRPTILVIEDEPPLKKFLRITGPIAANLIEVAAERRAMTGVAGKNGAQFLHDFFATP